MKRSRTPPEVGAAEARSAMAIPIMTMNTDATSHCTSCYLSNAQKEREELTHSPNHSWTTTIRYCIKEHRRYRWQKADDGEWNTEDLCFTKWEGFDMALNNENLRTSSGVNALLNSCLYPKEARSSSSFLLINSLWERAAEVIYSENLVKARKEAPSKQKLSTKILRFPLWFSVQN